MAIFFCPCIVADFATKKVIMITFLIVRESKTYDINDIQIKAVKFVANQILPVLIPFPNLILSTRSLYGYANSKKFCNA